jgi:hypothetical protein
MGKAVFGENQTSVFGGVDYKHDRIWYHWNGNMYDLPVD